LGVVVTDNLKVSLQCVEAASKASKVLGMITRQFRVLDKSSFVILYKGFIRPHLEYAVQAWSPYLRKDIGGLERVQRKATKLVKGFKCLTYEQRLQRLHLTTLEDRKMRGDLIETYKLLTGKENVDSGCFFQLDGSHDSTRGHQYKLQKHRSRLDVRKNFSATEWSQSGTSCLHMSSKLILLSRSKTVSMPAADGAIKATASTPVNIK